MNTIYVSLLILLVHGTIPSDSIDVSWTVGDNSDIKTTKTLPNERGSTLAVESYSICPNTILRIIVRSGEEIILDRTYHRYDQPYEISATSGEVQVQTILQLDNRSFIQCMTLGQAKIRYTYRL